MSKTGISIQKCNVKNAEQHNARSQSYIEAVNRSPNKRYSIFQDRTSLNSSWVNPLYAGRTLSNLLNEIRKEVKEKTGRSIQDKDRTVTRKNEKTGKLVTRTIAGSSPIREGVCPVESWTTIADFTRFKEWVESKGIHIVRIDIHTDEGYTDVVTSERSYNHHAHIIFDWMDHSLGKSIKLNKDDIREMQTQLAISLGMERGIAKEVTGKSHMSTNEWREKKAGETAQKIEDKIRKAFRGLQKVGDRTLKQFFKLNEYEGELKPDDRMLCMSKSLSSLVAVDSENIELEQIVDATEAISASIISMQNAIEENAEKINRLSENLPKFSLFKSRRRKMLEKEAELEEKIRQAAAEMARVKKETEAKVALADENAKMMVEQNERNAAERISAAERKANDAVMSLKSREIAIGEKEAEIRKRDTSSIKFKQEVEEAQRNFESRLDEARREAERRTDEKWRGTISCKYNPVIRQRDELASEVENLKHAAEREKSEHEATLRRKLFELNREWENKKQAYYVPVVKERDELKNNFMLLHENMKDFITKEVARIKAKYNETLNKKIDEAIEPLVKERDMLRSRNAALIEQVNALKRKTQIHL